MRFRAIAESRARARQSAARSARALDSLPPEGPWPKIIKQNQTPRKCIALAITKETREIRERSKFKSSAQWSEKIVLMTWKHVTRAQLPDGGRKSCARIGQCGTQNRKIDRCNVRRRQHRGRSARVDKNTFTLDFDQIGERFTANPIGGAPWRSSSSRFPGKRHQREKPIMCRPEHVNFPAVTGSQRAAGAPARSANSTAVREPIRRAPVLRMRSGASSK